MQPQQGGIYLDESVQDRVFEELQGFVQRRIEQRARDWAVRLHGVRCPLAVHANTTNHIRGPFLEEVGVMLLQLLPRSIVASRSGSSFTTTPF